MRHASSIDRIEPTHTEKLDPTELLLEHCDELHERITRSQKGSR